MENNQIKARNTEVEEPIDIGFLIRAVLKNWWVVLLVACTISMWTYMGLTVVKTPQYRSTATLIISSKSLNSNLYRDTAIEKAANQFQRIFTSDALKNIVTKKMGKNNLPGTLNADIQQDTNLLIVTGTSDNPVDAYRMVEVAMDNYMLVSDYVITDFVLEIMKAPEVPMESTDVLFARTMAIRVFLVGFIGAAAVIALGFLMRDDVKNEKQAKNALDIPLFATVYFERKRNIRSKNLTKRKKSILITNSNVSFSYKETMSKIATKLEYQAKKEGGKVILIASVSENEGKSTVAANVALALAKKQNNVLLFDTDLRRPALYKVFEKTIAKEQEIDNYFFSSKNGETDSVKHWKKEDMIRDPETGLYCLFGTKRYSKSDTLIRSEAMDQLLQEARKSMDYIILDSPPGMVTSDVELLAEKSDLVLLVVRQGVSCIGEINDMIDNLSTENGKMLGCIFNAVQSKIIPWIGHYGYSDGYYGGYYGYYGKSNKKQKKKAGETNNADI